MSFRITILGSSGAVPAFGRLPSSQLVEINSRIFLIDCGEGAQFQLLKLGKNIQKLDCIFISHLHGDHFLGLVGLLFTMHLKGRKKELHLFGFHGLEEIIIVQLRASRSALSYPIQFHILQEGINTQVYSDKSVTVESIPLKHKLPCSGFLIREKSKPRRINKTLLPEGTSFAAIASLKKGEDLLDTDGNLLMKNETVTFPPRHSRSYAYCSDTAYSETIVPVIAGVDILYHEATFTETHSDKALETQHSTARQAATIALKAGVKKLLIGHFSARYKETDELLNEALAVFPHSEIAAEEDTFEIQE